MKSSSLYTQTHTLATNNITFYPQQPENVHSCFIVYCIGCLIPSTSPCVIRCTPAGEFCCRPKTGEGPAGSSLWPTSTLANAYMQLEGLDLTHPPCPWSSSSTRPSLLQHLFSFPEGLFPLLPGSGAFVPGGVKRRDTRGWSVWEKCCVCIISYQDTHGIQCSSADKMNKQLGSLERRHCVITALISF